MSFQSDCADWRIVLNLLKPGETHWTFTVNSESDTLLISVHTYLSLRNGRFSVQTFVITQKRLGGCAVTSVTLPLLKMIIFLTWFSHQVNLEKSTKMWKISWWNTKTLLIFIIFGNSMISAETFRTCENRQVVVLELYIFTIVELDQI